MSNKYVSKLPVLNLEEVWLVDLTRLIQMGIAISEGRVERWADVDEIVFSIMNG